MHIIDTKRVFINSAKSFLLTFKGVTAKGHYYLLVFFIKKYQIIERKVYSIGIITLKTKNGIQLRREIEKEFCLE